MSYVNSFENVAVLDSEKQLENLLNTATLPSLWNVKCKGGKFVVAGIDGQVVPAEVQAVLDRLPGLTTQERDAVIRFVSAESVEVGNGNWGKVDEFFAFGLAGANALIGWKAKTATNNGAVLSVEGAETNGVNQYIDSNYNPSTDGVNYQQDDAQIETFVLTNNTTTSNAHPFGAFNPNRMRLLYQGASNDAGYSSNNNGFITLGSPAYQSGVLDAVTRTGAGASAWFRNGASFLSSTDPSTGLPNENIAIGALNNTVPGSFFNGTLSAFLVGGVLPDQAGHYTNLLEFLIELGTFADPVINSFPAALAAGEADRIRTFINAEVRAGNWGKYDSFFDFTLTNPLNALWDWVRKSSATNNGATFDVNGATFAGAQYIASNFIPSTDGVNYQLNNAQVEAYVKTDNVPVSTPAAILGDATSVNRLLINRGGNNLLSYEINEAVIAAKTTIANYGNNALWTAIRTSLNSNALYKNAILQDSSNTPSTGLPSGSVAIGGLATGNQFTGTLSTFLAGGVLPDQAAHNTNIRALLGL